MIEAKGFEVMNSDELYYINGGSGSSWGMSVTGSYTNLSNWNVSVTVTTSKNTYEAKAGCENGTFNASFTKTPNKQ